MTTNRTGVPATMRSIEAIGGDLGLAPEDLRRLDVGVAKVPLSTIRARRARGRKGKLVLVTGMTPTSHGEGKTVTTIGLAMALRSLGHPTVACLRQPSLGPVFGLKGGATGGGRSTVEPADEINLGFTGDLEAVTNAHNLLAAMLDNHLHFGNALGIERGSLNWPRTLDVDDRALRHVVVGVSGGGRDLARESNFVIAAASEVTAIHGLASDIPDLKARLGRILLGTRTGGAPLRASDLKATGAMATLLRRAIEPNLVQTVDGTPALVHGGPFANIAHGTASRLSLELALATSDYTVVEAGFSTELGAEKFVDIVARSAGLSVDAAVVIATVRGLRRQGGSPDADGTADAEAVGRGLENLAQHVENLRSLELTPVIALNRFPGDAPEETARVERFAGEQGVPIAISTPYADGAAGAKGLAEHVLSAVREGRHGRPLYPEGTSPEVAVETIARRLYGAAGIRLSDAASRELERLRSIGELEGPVCVAKTPLSLTDDPKRVGHVRGFTPTVRRFWRAAGAGFTVAYLGEVETMPGLPVRPLAETIDLTDDGRVVGLSP